MTEQVRTLATFAGALIAAMLLHTALVWNDIPATGLNYDEAQSLTFALAPLADIHEVISKLEPHPPLYYWQLHLWLKLHASDEMLRLNSLGWSILALLLLGINVRRVLGTWCAAGAVLLYAASPNALFYAAQGRMYTMLFFLAMLTWWGLDSLLKGTSRAGIAAGFVAALAALTAAAYSHGAGLLLIPCACVYAATSICNGATAGWRFLMAGAAALLAAVAILPFVLRAKNIHLTHMLKPGLTDVAATVNELVLGPGLHNNAWLSWGLLGTLVLLLVITLQLPSPALRALAAGFLITPLFLAAAISHLHNPIWRARTLSWVAPLFFVLLLGILAFAARPRPRWLRPVLVLMVLACAGALLNRSVQSSPYDWGFERAAAHLEAATAPGDVIIVPGRSFWAMTWYLSGRGDLRPWENSRYDTGRGQLANGLKPEEFAGGRNYWFAFPNDRRKELGFVNDWLKQGRLQVLSEKTFIKTVVIQTQLQENP